MAVFGLPDSGGRPRRISLPPWRNSPWRKKSFSSSGASSGSWVRGLPKYFAPAVFFFAMAVPHRNNVAAGAALSPYDHDHSALEETGADPANLAVIKPVVDHRYRVPGKTLSRRQPRNRDPDVRSSTRAWRGRRSFSCLFM